MAVNVTKTFEIKAFCSERWLLRLYQHIKEQPSVLLSPWFYSNTPNTCLLMQCAQKAVRVLKLKWFFWECGGESWQGRWICEWLALPERAMSCR